MPCAASAARHARRERVQLARATPPALTLSSPQNTSASPSSSARRRSSRFCAKLSRASGNQRAPGMRSRVDQHAVAGRRRSRRRTSHSSRQKSSLVIDRPPPQLRRSSPTSTPCFAAIARGKRGDVRLRDALRRRFPQLVVIGRSFDERRAAARRSCSGSGDRAARCRDRSTRSSRRRPRTLVPVGEDLVEAVDARAAGRAKVHPHFDLAGIDERYAGNCSSR